MRSVIERRKNRRSILTQNFAWAQSENTHLLSNVLNLYRKDKNEEKEAMNVQFVQDCSKRTILTFIRGSNTVWLTSCSTGLDSADLLMFNQRQIYLFGQIQSQTGGHLYSDTFPCKYLSRVFSCHNLGQMGHSWRLFLYFHLFNADSIHLIVNWIPTTVICCQKQLLFKLSHNHCPTWS